MDSPDYLELYTAYVGRSKPEGGKLLIRREWLDKWLGKE